VESKEFSFIQWTIIGCYYLKITAVTFTISLTDPYTIIAIILGCLAVTEFEPA
jgi:hypothetical protein